MTNFNIMAAHVAISKLREQERQKYDNSYFSEHYWREDLEGHTGNRGLSYDDPEHRERFSYLYELLVEQNNPKQLLDAGCGPGYLLEHALLDGISARGVDCSASAREQFLARTKGNWATAFHIGSICSMPFPDRSFDLLLCLDVLEHLIVFDIFVAANELSRLASKDLICSINLDNPYFFHPTIISRESWTALFESTGFVRQNMARTDALNRAARRRYSEYDFFVFERLAVSQS